MPRRKPLNASLRRRPLSNRLRFDLTMFGALLTWCWTLQTDAHGILVSRGAIEFSAERMAISLEVDAEDFLHLYGLGPDRNGQFDRRDLADSAHRYSEVLEAILAVYNADGTRLPAQAAPPAIDWPRNGSIEFDELRRLRVRYALAYPLPPETRFLTFQIVPLGDGFTLPLQFVLNAAPTAGNSPCSLRLTSGGNSETVALDDSDNTGFATAVRRINHLKEISAEVRLDEHHLQVKVVVPVPLLETFLPIPRQFPGILSPSELHAAMPEIIRLFSNALTVQVEDRIVPVEIVKCGWLSLDSAELRQDRPINALTGRLSVALRAHVPPAVAPPKLRWSLFNPVVLSVAVTIHSANPTEEHALTTYAPEIAMPTAKSR